MEDGELTYTLGFYPLQEAQDDWHNLKVEVDKPGVNLRYRENYFAARIAPAPATPTPAVSAKPAVYVPVRSTSHPVAATPTIPGSVANVLLTP